MPQQIVNNLMENFIMSSIHAKSIEEYRENEYSF